MLKNINDELKSAVMFSTEYPGVAERIEDFGGRFIPFLEKRIAHLNVLDIMDVDDPSAWENGITSVFETFTPLVTSFYANKTVSAPNPYPSYYCPPKTPEATTFDDEGSFSV